MIVISIRTDNPEAEVGLFDGRRPLEYEVWHAHRTLSATLHAKIEALLAHRNLDYQDVEGIVCYEGPGSFTGLRIGITTGNALAYGLGLPIVASSGEDWAQRGIERLTAGEHDDIVLPHYGADVHITTPRK